MRRLALFALLIPVAALAQEASPIAYRINPLPIISVTDIKATPEGKTVHGFFTIHNTEDRSVGNILYELQLIQPIAGHEVNVLYADDPIFYDRVIPPQDPIGLSAGQKKKIAFTYILPGVPKGEYRLRVRLKKSNDRQMGWLDTSIHISEISPAPYGMIEADSIDVRAVDPITKENNSSWAARSGPNVHPKASIKLRATVTNIGTVPMSGTIRIATKKSLYVGQGEDVVYGKSIALQPGEKKQLMIPIVAEQPPGAYQVLVSVVDGTTRMSGIAEYRYVVYGVSASVVSVLLRDISYRKGGEVTADFTIAGSADRVRAVKGILDATISDKKGDVGTTSDAFSIIGEIPLQGLATIPLNRNLCGAPSITMKITGEDGSILDTLTTTFPSKRHACGIPYWWGALVALIGIGGGIFLWRRRNGTMQS